MRKLARRVRATVPVAAVAAATIVASLAASSPAAAEPPAAASGVAPLPLGPAGLTQTATTRQIAAGVTLTTVTRGYASPADHWTVQLGFEATKAEADALAAKATADGFTPSVTADDDRPAGDPAHGPLGYLVLVGASQNESDEQTLAGQLTADGFSPSVTNTSLLETNTTGPWVVHVLRVDPRAFRGSVDETLSNGVVPGRETVSSIVSRVGALAGVNGGFFIINDGTGTLGAASGVQAVDGDLTADTDSGRAALILPNSTAGTAHIARVTTTQSVSSSDGARAALTGVDRALGYVRDCTEPNYVVSCATSDDLVAFDADFGDQLDSGTGAEAILDAHGRVVSLLDSRGGTLPAGDTAIEGIGSGAAWLTAHAKPGDVLHVAKSVNELTAHGSVPVPLGPATGIVNGGPLLVQNGQVNIDAETEAFNPPSDPADYFGFAGRNPRTMVGITSDHDLLLVTVDGREPGYSVGLNFTEEARLMRALGSVSAMNLDGGGSTEMVVGDAIQGEPSGGAERPIGDAIVLSPTRN